MSVEVNEQKNKKRMEVPKKSWLPLIQVDKHGDPVSNFLNNLIRQFKKAKGLNLFIFFQWDWKKQNKVNSESIMGSSKTIISPKNSFHTDNEYQKRKSHSLRQGHNIQSDYEIQSTVVNQKLKF